jgi:hypothetical protein
MEMDRQTIIVLFSAILGLTLFGGMYLSAPAKHPDRPMYAQEDIRAKFQKEALKEKKTKKKKVATEPVISSSESSGGSSEEGGGESDEEPTDDGPQEEPELE